MNFLLDTNICLDLLDTRRPNAQNAVEWYSSKKDDPKNHFFFFADAITTIYYVLTERKKIDPVEVVAAIKMMSEELEPLYMHHQDFQRAVMLFQKRLLTDLEDLMMLSVAHRCRMDRIVTRDKELYALKTFESIALEHL